MGASGNSGKVLPLDRRQLRFETRRGWGTQDIADLYRIGDQLTQFGFPVAVHIGQSDEGDPWAVFERKSTSDVVVHIARIDAILVVVDVVSGHTYRGHDFRSLADRLLAEAPLMLPRGGNSVNVVLHPRMVMTAFVAAALIVSEFAEPAGAAETSATVSVSGTALLPVLTGTEPGERVAGRDGLGGMPGALTIGITSLAACLATISAHLVLAAAEGQTESVSANAPRIVGLFEGVRTILTSPPTILDGALQDRVGKPDVVDNLGPEGAPPTRPAAPELAGTATQTRPASILIDDVPDHPRGVSAFAVENIGIRLAPLAQEGANHDGVVQTSPAPLPVEAPAQLDAPFAATQVTAVFDSVNASVLLLDQYAFSAFDLDPEAEGAVVLQLSGALTDLDHYEEAENVVVQLSKALTSLDFDPEADDSVVVQPSGLLEDEFDTASLTNDFPTSATGAPQQYEQYLLVIDLSDTVYLAPDVVNVVVYMGGEVEVSGFTFGHDRLAFIEDAAELGWLTSVEIVGTDVVLVGSEGNSVTLSGAAATLI